MVSNLGSGQGWPDVAVACNTTLQESEVFIYTLNRLNLTFLSGVTMVISTITGLEAA